MEKRRSVGKCLCHIQNAIFGLKYHSRTPKLSSQAIERLQAALDLAVKELRAWPRTKAERWLAVQLGTLDTKDAR